MAKKNLDMQKEDEMFFRAAFNSNPAAKKDIMRELMSRGLSQKEIESHFGANGGKSAKRTTK